MDPCEKEPTDALDNMVPQDREEITADAQVTMCCCLYSVVKTETTRCWGEGVSAQWQSSKAIERKMVTAALTTVSGWIFFVQNAFSHIKALFSSSSIFSKLCGGLPSDRSTRSLAWSLCRHPRPTLATANGGWTAATWVKERGRARRTKRKKQTLLDRCFNLLC